MAQVKLNRLTKQFGSLTVLKNISLTIRSGEFLTLLGPSGCGKSTLLRIIAGLEPASGGSVYIDDNCMDRIRPKDRNIAMVFQSYALYPHLTVFDNIATPLRMHLLNAPQRIPMVGRFVPGYRSIEQKISSMVLEVAQLLDISHLLNRKPARISGGQRQRVALGRAMVRNPSVFLMDEPLSNLDAKLRVHMRTEIAGLHRKLKTTFIYVTHDQAEAMTMSSRIALMIDGTLFQVGPPTQIYQHPSHLKVAEFIGNPKINILPGIAHGNGDVICCGLRLPVALQDQPSGNIRIGIRPESLEAVDTSRPGWQGTVFHIEHMGAYFLVHIQVAGSDQPLILRAGPHQMPVPETGTSIKVGTAPKNLHFFGKDGARIAVSKQLELATAAREVLYA